MHEPIDISLIESYAFCPKQAKNKLDPTPDNDTLMSSGSEAHQNREEAIYKGKTREAFKKTRLTFGEHNLSPNALKSLIKSLVISDKSKSFVEFWVESKELGIKGFCDQISIDKGSISIIEYKTTFRPNEEVYFSQAAISQARAYAKAFMDYYDYQGPIRIIIQRVYLKFDWALADWIDETKAGYLNRDTKEIISDGWSGALKEVYNQPFYPDTDLDEIREIISKLRKKDFRHENNIRKCEKCQYNLSCEDNISKI